MPDICKAVSARRGSEGRILRLLIFPFLVASGAALAQVTGTVNPTPSPNDDVPAGGCMPMGITASGEVVFPFQCKAFLEQHRGKDANQESVVAPALDEAPAATQQKPAALNEMQTIAAPPDKSRPVNRPVRAVPQSKRAEDRPRATASCTYFQSYDPASRTYMAYDGRRRPCP